MAEQIEVFALPDVGEGLTEGEILTWHVQPGDVVTVNQTIVEIETAKAAVELPCPYAGTVVEVHAAPGTVVPVGAPIISIRVESKVPEREAVLVGYGVKHDAPRRRPRKASANGSGSNGHHGDVRVKPLVRKLAKDLGVDLGTIAGTGANGDITREDILASINDGPSAPAEPVTVAVRGDERIPVRGVQKSMAEAMVLSAFSAPHVTIWVEVEMTRTLELVRRMREHPTFKDLRVTPLTIASAAIIRSALQHPRINATWTESAQGADVIQHTQVHLGIAADTPRGLLVPVVKHASSMGLEQLARAQKSLIETARSGRSSPADLTGSTITVTNVGIFGVDGGTPIINPGESAIVAMGRIIDKPWVVDGSVQVRPVMTLSLSFDHRVCDGAQGSRALVSIADFLSDPAVELLLDA